jgi:Zn-finger nucleic acid-binding protein
MTLRCPRDGQALRPDRERGIDIDRCPACAGAWYDYGELHDLEASASSDEDALAGTIDYARHASPLRCLVCGEGMTSFNYRGNNLELDVCPHQHGFWLDAGEAARVRALMQERVQGLRRARAAQRRWNRSREAGFRDSFFDRLIDRLRGR